MALNEAMFREANERMAKWEERHERSEHEPSFCECANRDCKEKIPLTREEYERVRERSDHFVVVPGHIDPAIENVVETNERFQIVEKHDDVARVVIATDPRRNDDG